MGVVSTPDGGEFAWFLRLEADGNGAFHDHRRWLRICAWRVGPDKQFSFETQEAFERTFWFGGVSGDSSIQGQLESRMGQSRRSLGAVAFELVEPGNAFGVSPGVYSSLEDIPDVGDTRGSVVFVGSVAGSPKITLAWSEGTLIGPYVARDITRFGDTLYLDVGPAEGYHVGAQFHETGMQFWFGDRGESVTNVKRVPRTRSLAAFFGEQSLGACTR